MAEEDTHEEPELAELVDDSGGKASDKTLVLARHLFPDRLPIIPLDRRPLFPRMTVPMVDICFS